MTRDRAPVALLVVDVQQVAIGDDPQLGELTDRIVSFAVEHREHYALVACSRFRNLRGSTYDRIVGSDLRDPFELHFPAGLEQVSDLTLECTTYSSFVPDVQNVIVAGGAARPVRVGQRRRVP